MAPKTFADRPINKLVLFDVDGTLTPARQVEIILRLVPAFSSVTFFYLGDIERISCDARTPVRVAKESRHRVRGGLRSP